MLTISQDLRARIIAHARADHPDEACGVIAGPVGLDRPERFIPMLNAERSPTFYRFDSLEQLRVWREMDDRDEEPVIIYHSHSARAAYPSRTDISYASEPGAHYVLVSTRDPEQAEFRSFRIIDGVVTEEEVNVSADADPGGRAGAAGSITPPPRVAIPSPRPSDVDDLLASLAEAPLAVDELRSGLKRLAGMEPTPPPPGIAHGK